MSGAGFRPLSMLFRSLHPNLTDDNHEVTSDASLDYNCIAHALALDDAWYEPGGRDGTEWPPGVPDDESLDGWIACFVAFGYEICSDAALDPLFERIAIYGDSEAGLHAARQLPSGRWSSKCGQAQDISHDLAALEDRRYGQVRVFMRRPVTP